jgi:hypothetical protein
MKMIPDDEIEPSTKLTRYLIQMLKGYPAIISKKDKFLFKNISEEHPGRLPGKIKKALEEKPLPFISRLFSNQWKLYEHIQSLNHMLEVEEDDIRLLHDERLKLYCLNKKLERRFFSAFIKELLTVYPLEYPENELIMSVLREELEKRGYTKARTYRDAVNLLIEFREKGDGKMESEFLSKLYNWPKAERRRLKIYAERKYYSFPDDFTTRPVYPITLEIDICKNII